MNFLSLMSGPLMALVRYGVTAGSAYALGKGIPAGVVTEVGALITTVAPAIIGALTSTKDAAIAKVNAVPGLAVVPEREANKAGVKPVVTTASADPTWVNPNAR